MVEEGEDMTFDNETQKRIVVEALTARLEETHKLLEEVLGANILDAGTIADMNDDALDEVFDYEEVLA
jgi:hypothetical protein